MLLDLSRSKYTNYFTELLSSSFTTMHSVVINVEATETAFSIADLNTFAGSMILLLSVR